MKLEPLKRYIENLKAERNAIVLYDNLRTAEPNSELAAVYGKLADVERKHAAFWEAKIREAGAEVPNMKPNGKTRLLSWLARRFGTKLVLPTITALEQNAGSEYDAQGPGEIAQMASEEKSHARVFQYLSRTSGGMEGRAVARFEGRHKTTGGNALRAGVLGANDGLVSNFSLIMGVAGAEMQSAAILLTGLAGLLAGAISMALGEWLSVQSSRELYTHQMKIEEDELTEAPEEEKEELALIYQAKGVAPEEAQRLADRLLADPATALDTLAREELGIDPEELGGSAWEAAGASFLLFAVGAIVPVLPYFFMEGIQSVVVSALCSAVGLFVIGAAITLMTGRSILWSGFRQVLFGLVAAAVTFGIGRLIGVHVGG
ncbi:MAG TPA: rubrerythrin family protein [Verrucomicrobia bacterium]|nr:MAG: rubrerythrin family protein [Lentisphaerae bacterium GWF2_57_35]HBA85536.1 rubrerythrin family protein [Verrucomicrobiota bacterium]